MSVIVYSKPACVQCTATTRAMDAKGIAYDVVDLTEDANAMTRVTELGYRQAPRCDRRRRPLVRFPS